MPNTQKTIIWFICDKYSINTQGTASLTQFQDIFGPCNL